MGARSVSRPGPRRVVILLLADVRLDGLDGVGFELVLRQDLHLLALRTVLAHVVHLATHETDRGRKVLIRDGELGGTGPGDGGKLRPLDQLTDGGRDHPLAGLDGTGDVLVCLNQTAAVLADEPVDCLGLRRTDMDDRVEAPRAAKSLGQLVGVVRGVDDDDLLALGEDAVHDIQEIRLVVAGEVGVHILHEDYGRLVLPGKMDDLRDLIVRVTVDEGPAALDRLLGGDVGGHRLAGPEGSLEENAALERDTHLAAEVGLLDRREDRSHDLRHGVRSEDQIALIHLGEVDELAPGVDRLSAVDRALGNTPVHLVGNVVQDGDVALPDRAGHDKLLRLVLFLLLVVSALLGRLDDALYTPHLPLSPRDGHLLIDAGLDSEKGRKDLPEPGALRDELAPAEEVLEDVGKRHGAVVRVAVYLADEIDVALLFLLLLTDPKDGVVVGHALGQDDLGGRPALDFNMREVDRRRLLLDELEHRGFVQCHIHSVWVGMR